MKGQEIAGKFLKKTEDLVVGIVGGVAFGVLFTWENG